MKNALIIFLSLITCLTSCHKEPVTYEKATQEVIDCCFLEWELLGNSFHNNDIVTIYEHSYTFRMSNDYQYWFDKSIFNEKDSLYITNQVKQVGNKEFDTAWSWASYKLPEGVVTMSQHEIDSITEQYKKDPESVPGYWELCPSGLIKFSKPVFNESFNVCLIMRQAAMSDTYILILTKDKEWKISQAVATRH